MADFVRIGSRSEMPGKDEAREFTAGGRIICVANVAGHLSAMDNVCAHRGGPLGQGLISGGKLICPWHGWEFDCRSGRSLSDDLEVESFPVIVENGNIFIEVP